MNCFFAYTDNDRWVAGIGDPTVLGWVTVAAYFLGALTCWAAARRARFKTSPVERYFWLGFAAVLVALGVNKQLDLQTWFTLFGRRLARQDGWYEYRRLIQAVFVFVISLSAMISLAVVWKLARRSVPHYQLAMVGGVFLVGFILIRAASFHHMDQLLGVHIGAVRLNHVFEMGGIGCIAFAAYRALQSERRSLGPGGPNQFVLPHSRERAF